jgi:hypothetical protein
MGTTQASERQAGSTPGPRLEIQEVEAPTSPSGAIGRPDAIFKSLGLERVILAKHL